MPCSLRNIIISKYVNIEFCFQYHLISQIAGFFPDWVLNILGVSLIVIGIPFFLISVVTAMKAYNANELVTNGIFICCRHPLYASWVAFIVPGIVFLANTWIGLTAPIFMYFILRVLVQKEEIYLEKVFGSEYFDYKKKVPCILPYGWLKSSV